MTAERWRKVNSIFHAAADQTGSDREELLRRECGDDTDLYEEVQRMLREMDRSGFMDHPPLAQHRSSVPLFQPGEMLAGRYEIEGFLGRGGMGEVYAARDMELKEAVALKTLLPAIADDGRMIARFKSEIQLSRKVSHPNVCRVFDLARHPADASSPESVVFLSMELLEGETLSSKLDREGRMCPAEALPLLGQMAEGLDAAHSAGVIHRDFKTSNVMLVASGDGVRAVVTDFGLAFRPVRSDDTTATLTGTLMGTLDYMAPEVMEGGSASVASDVYALGTVAYKMATGVLPFPANQPLAGAILRSKGPPPLLRTHVSDIAPRWEQAVARSLDPNPGRRYARATDFVRALRGENSAVTVALPVVTRRRAIVAGMAVFVLAAGGIAWRSWKHARSQPPAEATGYYRTGTDDIHAGAYFAATKALGYALSLAPKFSVAHARLAEAWLELEVSDKASREALLALQQDNSDLSSLERLQIEAISQTVTRDFASAAGKYEEMRRLAPNDSDLELDAGRAYERAGQPDKALASFRRVAQASKHNPAAWVRLGILYRQASDWSKSAEAFGKAQDLYETTSNFEGLTEVEFQLGISANSRGQLEEAAGHLSKAMATARLAGNVQQEIRSKLQLSINAYSTGDIALAERWAQEALDTARASQTENLAIRGVVNLGNSYLLKRDFAGAEKYYQDALSLARRSNSPRLTAVSLLSLASLHDQLKQPEQSNPEAQEALSFWLPNHFVKESGQCLMILGRAQRYRGDYPGAVTFLHRGLQIAEQSRDRQQMGLAHENLGSILFAQEQYPQALPHYEESLRLSPDAQHIGYAAFACGNVLWLLGRYDEAQEKLNHADTYSEKFPSLRLDLLQTRAEMSLTRSRYSEAATFAVRALESDTGQSALTIAGLKRILALAQLGLGKSKEALRNSQEALAEAAKLNDVATLFRCQIALLQARLKNGDRAGALSLFHEMEPRLVSRPESRWRALALIARVDRQYAAQASQALDNLGRLWGDAPYRTYLQRTDVQILRRPLLKQNSATQK